MYLKSLDINGFKSFAEKTTIQLSDEVNVIVGPNGSGKSNVVDAISWVLGTQSPATLRTNKMEDVIFAGTEKLSEKGFAEVYLNFEVDEQKFNGNSETSIGRKLFKDGTSEYFMNGLNCRLLDIQEFLSDVGIGKQQHIIISQGQIAEILNSKPEDHRLTIEEASGILPLRSKKEKALKRIESGDKEIKRAKDVLREIRKQLKPLQEQAEQARLHEDVTNQLKDRNIKLHTLLYRKFKNEYDDLKIKENILSNLIDSIELKVEDLKKEKLRINNELGDGVSIGSTFKEYSSKINNVTEQLRSIAQVANERKDNLEREDFRNIEQINKISKKIDQNSDQINMLSNQLVSKQYSLKNLQSTYDDLKTQLESVIKKSSASKEVNEALLENEIKSLQKNISETSQDLGVLNLELSKWESDVKNSEDLLQKFNNDIKSTEFNTYSKDEYVTFHQNILSREFNSSKEKIDQITSISNQLVTSQERIKNLTEQNNEFLNEKEKISSTKNATSKSDLQKLVSEIKDFIRFTNKTSNLLAQKSEEFDDKYGNTNKKIQKIDSDIEQLNKNYFDIKEEKTAVVIKLSENQVSTSSHFSALKNIYGLNDESLLDVQTDGLIQHTLENEIKNYETQLENLGTVNYLAKEDFETLNSRHKEITGNIEDLNLAKKELNSHIKEIENEISFRIESSFNSISVHFSEIFETLFPGGKGSLSFTDKENILETGIDI